MVVYVSPCWDEVKHGIFIFIGLSMRGFIILFSFVFLHWSTILLYKIISKHLLISYSYRHNREANMPEKLRLCVWTQLNFLPPWHTFSYICAVPHFISLDKFSLILEAHDLKYTYVYSWCWSILASPLFIFSLFYHCLIYILLLIPLLPQRHGI